jgi:hypothetical protein
MHDNSEAACFKAAPVVSHFLCLDEKMGGKTCSKVTFKQLFLRIHL